ncbi:hypothetical protein IC614_11195 [Allosphingosinicella flava]|uniref:Uncharacterized protein n=1 Tax=Allosphingosinicella flava TaxID=2771430 RepID=A0A7T2GJ70_9SPHN|nr:hypothetical protein [Sphingosinicella flava]QPQ54868.1 hypothetical protein IC614_11195 [Sphingosinicella flava]
MRKPGSSIRRSAAFFVMSGLTTACVPSVAEQAPAPAAPVVAAPIPANYGGLGTVIGRTAETLERAFGRPDLDVREGNARKLQFSSSLCVLDTYLYPPGGRGEPVVTHVDARRPDGSDFDRASCVAALGQAR